MVLEGKEIDKKKEKKKVNKKRAVYIAIIIILLATLVLASTSDIFVRWYIPTNLAPSITLLHPDDDDVILANTTYFNWTSTDPEGDTINYVWYADQLHTFSSPFRRNVDVNTTENYTANPFMDGHWYWRVEGTDGSHVVNSETRHFIIRSNISNSFPTLSNMQVSPGNGDTETDFIYSVIYTDLDNTSADYVRVYIDGTNYTMTESDASDTSTSDGKTFQYTTNLTVGLHNYSFACSDGTASTITELYNGPYVSHYTPPETPPSGGSPGEKMNKVTIQPKNNIGYPEGSFYGNLAITEESYNYEYEIYWYLFLLDSNDNEINSNSGSLALHSSVTVAYDIAIPEEIEKGEYRLFAKTFDEPREQFTSTQLGMDEITVEIKDEPLGNDAVEEVKTNEFLQYFLIVFALIFAILAVVWTKGFYLIVTLGVFLLLLLVFDIFPIQFFSVLGIILIMAGCLFFTRIGDKIPIKIHNIKIFIGAFLIFLGFIMYFFQLI